MPTHPASKTDETPSHHLQYRYLAEDLVRRRRSDEPMRYLAGQRAAKIDANPHQIDAVIFALARLAEGGCILADEVGLGKTIEAGLIIAQRLAEGVRRVLVITPKALLGQWREELATLFGIDAREGAIDALEGDGVFIVTRDFIGGEKGAAACLSTEPFELFVVDEAHELFSGLHKRFDQHGQLRDDGAEAKMAGRFFAVVRAAQAPVLLLTATPMQNALTELWSLVHYVDPSGTLLGELNTFKALFCEDDDRQLAQGQAEELRDRLARVCQRTLRRQAEAFLDRPFSKRQARVFEYTMSLVEKQLYDDITDYLLQPDIAGFDCANRRLLLLGFWRRMASSPAALAASLNNIVLRLKRLLGQAKDGVDEEVAELATDLDELAEDAASAETHRAAETDVEPIDVERIEAELAQVQSFERRARALKSDAKAQALLKAVNMVLDDRHRSGKVLVFTESLKTQAYIKQLLIEADLVAEHEITLFRGVNDSPRARQALAKWERDVASTMPAHTRPSPDIAQRQALVYEFRRHSKVFISTESGAKGLNLQFCDTIINYDLPWNPQRIEQRIGRCHRYGQTSDVTVINFLASDNEAQRLTLDILSQKLQLFGAVLGASDEVLHEGAASDAAAFLSAVGPSFESEIARIHERARTREDLEQELQKLGAALDGQSEKLKQVQQKTIGLIESRLDEKVRQVFGDLKASMASDMRAIDQQVLQVVAGWLQQNGIEAQLQPNPDVAPELIIHHPTQLPDAAWDSIAHLQADRHSPCILQRFAPDHPLVRMAVIGLRQHSPASVNIALPLNTDGRGAWRGRHGRLRLLKSTHHGFETYEQLFAVATLAPDTFAITGDDAIWLLLAGTLKTQAIRFPQEKAALGVVLDDLVDESLFLMEDDISSIEQARYEAAMAQVERYLQDRLLLLEREYYALKADLSAIQAARTAAKGADARERAEQKVLSIADNIERVEGKITQLRNRTAPEIENPSRRANERRFRPPIVEALFEVEVEIT